MKLPTEKRVRIENAYRDMMGHFPTENQKFAVELPVGILLGQMTTSGIRMAMVNCTTVSSTIPKRIEAPLGIEHTGGMKRLKHSVLPNEFTETFAGGRYTSRILEKDMILYRAGFAERKFGNYFSKDKPKSEVQVRMDKAIPPIWQDGPKNVIDTVYTYKVPAGTVVHAGKISSQNKHFIGGTQQVVIEERFWQSLQLLKKEPLK
jgi:hypothetical protein